MIPYAALADLLDYPRGDLAAAARACAAALAPGHRAAAALERFAASLPAPGALEEIYTRTFDLAPSCAPYVGHQLLGEDGRRSVLLSRLAALFRERGFAVGDELPDHLCVLLRFLARDDRGEEADDVVTACLLPAVARMIGQVPADGNPYHAALEALHLLLEERARAEG